ncbi:MAG TPA: hypothetical protein VMD59_18355 [Acidimicrobiales bacterium]|nr:hypothetical protein [Acidimicrobiales bacterium]
MTQHCQQGSTVFEITQPGLYEVEYALPTTAFSPFGDVEVGAPEGLTDGARTQRSSPASWARARWG